MHFTEQLFLIIYWARKKIIATGLACSLPLSQNDINCQHLAINTKSNVSPANGANNLTAPAI